MNFYAIAAFFGVAITVVCQVLYLHALYKRQARPHFFTYFNWGLMAAIGCFVQENLEGGESVYVMGVAAISYWLIAVLAIFVGEKNITRSDWVAFISALFAIGIWQAGASPLYAVALVSFIDMATYYPTVRKSWADPWGEPPLPYFIAGSRYVFAALAVSGKNLDNTLAPILLGSTDLFFAIYLVWRRRVLGGAMATSPRAADSLK